MNFVDLENFQKIEKIGKGSFGEVLKVKDKETGEIYAAKIGFKSLDEETKDSKINLAREVNLLSQLNHPSILKFIGYSPYNFEKKNKPIIITEYSPNGSLYDILELERSGRSPKEWDSTKKLINIYGIANAMLYLHSNNIIHRDLKPQNILENDYLFPKISDFGFSKVYHQNLDSITIQSTACFKGTPIYTAPEIWKRNQYSKEGDVYAFSFILYEIITGQQPFNGYTSFNFAIEVVQSGKRPDFNYEIPEAYRSLIERCWDEEPKNRPSFDQIVIELKENQDFILDDIDQNDYLNYVDYIDQCKKSFDSENKILNIEDVLKNRQSKLLHKVVIKKKNLQENQHESYSSPINDEKKEKYQSFYEELTKSGCFERMSQNVKRFFNYRITPETKEKRITLTRNNLSNLSNSLLSSNFINVLKLFDQINIELRYPSYNFQKMFDAVKSIKEKDLHRINVHLHIISDETNFILGTNQTLDTVKLSPYVYRICDSSFNGCQTLKEIIIPSSVTRIGEMAFSGCIQLEEVEILPSVSSFGKGAFKGCLNLKEITINPIKTKVDFTAFQDCPKLDSMILTSDDSHIKTFNEDPFHNITKIKIHPSIESIWDCTFKGFSSIKEIIFPSTIKYIGNDAFNKCQSLEKVIFPKKLISIDYCAFYGCTSLKEIKLPLLEEIDSFILFGCTSLTELNLPFSIELIKRCAFSNCTSLSRVNMHSKLLGICEGVFKGCISLEEINLSLNLKIVESRAFEGCSKLKKIGYIESNRDDKEECYFGDYIFKNCSSLDNVDLPHYYKMKSIPVGFFRNCSSLSSFDFSELSAFYTVDENSFRGCSSLTEITIPKTVSIIEENAFRDCKSLTELIIPEFVSTIGKASFMNCTSLKKVSLMTNLLTSIEDHLFDGCCSLEEINLPDSVSTIGKFSFSGCTAIETVKIPDSVCSIGDCAFLNCYSLIELKFPSELKDIGEDCFKGCNSLKIDK